MPETREQPALAGVMGPPQALGLARGQQQLAAFHCPHANACAAAVPIVTPQHACPRVMEGVTLASLRSWPWASGLYMGSDTWHTLRGCSMYSAPLSDTSAMPIACTAVPETWLSWPSPPH